MNITVLIAGIIAALATIGHFTMGTKQFLNPMLEAEFNPISKKVMHAVFHYISVFLALSAFFLIMVGARGMRCVFDPFLILVFIGGNYALFAILQIIIALSSKASLLKMFQWVFWIAIAILVFMGV
jgi:VIT1/CCC1 family predicted Fe2+/Mn2+ transporter